MSAERSTEYSPCPSCFGKKKLVDEEGRTCLCSDCEATGKIKNPPICKLCGGDGRKETVLEGITIYVTCKSCGGLGVARH